jgi:hypothetical protein
MISAERQIRPIRYSLLMVEHKEDLSNERKLKCVKTTVYCMHEA